MKKNNRDLDNNKSQSEPKCRLLPKSYQTFEEQKEINKQIF